MGRSSDHNIRMSELRSTPLGTGALAIMSFSPIGYSQANTPAMVEVAVAEREEGIDPLLLLCLVVIPISLLFMYKRLRSLTTSCKTIVLLYSLFKVLPVYIMGVVDFAARKISTHATNIRMFSHSKCYQISFSM